MIRCKNCGWKSPTDEKYPRICPECGHVAVPVVERASGKSKETVELKKFEEGAKNG